MLTCAMLTCAVLTCAMQGCIMRKTCLIYRGRASYRTKAALSDGKKVDGLIIKLEILADAKRSSATGRKCRCSAAKVLEIQTLNGKPAGVDSVTNANYAPHVTYTVGETVLPDSYDDDRWNECSHGIHFFITRQEAVDYN